MAWQRVHVKKMPTVGEEESAGGAHSKAEEVTWKGKATRAVLTLGCCVGIAEQQRKAELAVWRVGCGGLGVGGVGWRDGRCVGGRAGWVRKARAELGHAEFRGRFR